MLRKTHGGRNVKKLIGAAVSVYVALAVVFLAATLARAGDIEDRNYSVTCQLALVSTGTYVIAGELLGIYVDLPATNPACGFTVTTKDGQTLFSKTAVTADTYYRPSGGVLHDATGAAVDSATILGTNCTYRPWVMDSEVYVVMTNNASSRTGTNTYGVKLVYRR
jgi:hypothetical protein